MFRVYNILRREGGIMRKEIMIGLILIVIFISVLVVYSSNRRSWEEKERYWSDNPDAERIPRFSGIDRKAIRSGLKYTLDGFG